MAKDTVVFNRDTLLGLANDARSEARQRFSTQAPPGDELVKLLQTKVHGLIKQQIGRSEVDDVTFRTDISFLGDILNGDPVGEWPIKAVYTWLVIAHFSIALMAEDERRPSTRPGRLKRG